MSRFGEQHTMTSHHSTRRVQILALRAAFVTVINHWNVQIDGQEKEVHRYNRHVMSDPKAESNSHSHERKQ